MSRRAESHRARIVVASVLALCVSALVACARGARVSRAALVSWESRYVAAAQCRPVLSFGDRAPGDSSGVGIVDDERICERAARSYGIRGDPPRRVVVADAVNFYVVYDPSEPVALGEYDQWLVLDRRFRVLARMAL